MGAIAGDGVDDRDAPASALEFEVEAELVDQGVVEEVEGNEVLVGALHARNDLTCGVENRPVEVGIIGNVRLDVERGIGVGRKELG